MKERIEKIINGTCCFKCKNSHLYLLKDGRFKCSICMNKYHPKIFQENLIILHYFSLEIPAHKASKDLNLGYNKVLWKYMEFRTEIDAFAQKEFHRLSGEIECDESYFGGKRKGPRGRGSANKIKVLGLLERQGRIYTAVVENVKAETVLSEIKGHSKKGSVFYTDQFRSYKSLKFYGKHLTIDHGKEFKKGRRHINGLEGFWSFAKERLLKYHGVSQKYFYLYLKEMEFRYNYRKQNLLDILIKIHFSPYLN